MAKALAVLALLAPAWSISVSVRQQQASHLGANPIRKVVNLLQALQTKVTEEGHKEEALYNNFMCYCQKGSGTLEASIEAAKGQIEQLETTVKEAASKKQQTEQDLAAHQKSREEAREAVARAEELRAKEAVEYAAAASSSKTNLEALSAAIAALEKGVAGSFLQSSAAATVRRFAMEKAEIPDEARQAILIFLSGSQSQDYAPKSSEIIGLLKGMLDDMSKADAEAAAAEQAAILSYRELKAAKEKEIEALTLQIEQEQLRIGELAVLEATSAHDLKSTQVKLEEDGKLLADLEVSCKTKTQEWQDIQKLRGEELVAIAETIKALNDDDTLELFKKALPPASFLQVKAAESSLRARALAAVRGASASPKLSFIALALQGRQVGLEKVAAMIDELVANLKTEQLADDEKKAYCAAQLDSAEDKQKELEHAIGSSDTAIAEVEGSIAALREQIKALQEGIKALDASVKQATKQRKDEHEEHVELMADDNAAKEVLLWAKNRLNKFYNPALYVEPTPAPALMQARRQLPPPPESFGPYAKKSEESNGIIAMIDTLVADLDKEMQESEVSEKNAQQEYEQLVAQSAKSRAADAQAITEKESAVAAEEEALQAEKDRKGGAHQELAGLLELIHSLHGECDWLVQHFDVRKEARDNEIDALGKSKAVLSGASFALLQSKTSRRSSRFLGA